MQREEAAERLHIYRAIARDDLRVGIELIEELGQQANLVLAHLPEEFRSQLLFLEKIKHLRRTIVARRPPPELLIPPNPNQLGFSHALNVCFSPEWSQKAVHHAELVE